MVVEVVMKITKFRKLSSAQGFVSHAVKMQVIVLGDNGEYWVVRPVDAVKLERQGYELA